MGHESDFYKYNSEILQIKQEIEEIKFVLKILIKFIPMPTDTKKIMEILDRK